MAGGVLLMAVRVTRRLLVSPGFPSEDVGPVRVRVTRITRGHGHEISSRAPLLARLRGVNQSLSFHPPESTETSPTEAGACRAAQGSSALIPSRFSMCHHMASRCCHFESRSDQQSVVERARYSPLDSRPIPKGLG